MAESKSIFSHFMQRMKPWGPWKRWRLYREYLKHKEKSSEFSNRDAEDNDRSRLPNEEGLQVPAIWVVELYTPSTVNGLLNGIANLGWENGRSRDDELSKWMSNVRMGRTAGEINLGLVSPPNAIHFMRERTAPLPTGVQAAFPKLVSLTPSLTAFSIVFLTRDDAAASLEPPLRAEFKTYTYPLFSSWDVIRYILINRSIRFGRSIFHPDSIREKAVGSKLQELETNCTQWVRKHFPGVFAELGSPTPSASLLVTEQARPLSPEAARITAFNTFDISYSSDAWESDEWPGARLVLPYRFNNARNRLIFACRRIDAFPETSGYSDPTSNWTIAQRADDFVYGLLSRHAITNLLDAYHHTLSELRDNTARDKGYRAIRDLKILRTLSRTTLYDVAACAPEIIEFASSNSFYLHNVMEMFQIRKNNGAKYELAQNLMKRQKNRAAQILKESDLLRSTLSMSGDLSQTISNIRLQRLILILTIASIGIALWTGLLTLKASQPNPEKPAHQESDVKNTPRHYQNYPYTIKTHQRMICI